MPKTKISEFSATPGNNTDIDGINIAEGCAPSGINDAIRELMAQLKDFQAGTAGDSFNGPIGATTPAAGTFTNLSASGTFALTGDQVQISEGGTGQTTANAAFNALAPSQSTHAGKYLKTDGTNTSWDAIEINTADITGTLPVANGGTGVTSSTGTGSVVLSASPTFTGTVNGAALTLSSNFTLSGGTANGVAYLNGSKVLTTGSALTFDSSDRLIVGAASAVIGQRLEVVSNTSGGAIGIRGRASDATGVLSWHANAAATEYARIQSDNTSSLIFGLGASGTEQARLTSTGLGIGTSSPGAKLDVWGSSGDQIRVRTASTEFYRFGRNNVTGAMEFYGSQSGYQAYTFGGVDGTWMTINASGNLGLGVTPSAWGSSYKAIEIGGVVSYLSSANQYFGMYANAYRNSGGTIVYTTTGVASQYLQDLGAHKWFTAPSGTAGNTISFTQAMTLDANGLLQVGTTSNVGGARVDVVSNATSAYTARSSSSGASTTVKAVRSVDSSAGNFANAQYDALSHAWILSNSTQALTLDASGNLLVGTTSAIASERLNVTGSVATGFVSRIINANATNPQGMLLYYSGASPNSSTAPFLYCLDTTTLRAEIRSNGGLANYSANNVNLSDQRLKTDVQPAGSYLDKICAIPVKTYLYKDQTDTERNLGVMAQDVDAVAPELIDHSGFGETPEGESPYLAVYQTDLQYALMKCIQELKAQNDDLRARVAQLEAK